MQAINIVWVKRDLRTQDHLPLSMAEKEPLPYLIIFLFEPTLIQAPDTSLRHLQFQYHSAIEMNNTLKAFGRSINICYVDALSLLTHLASLFDIKKVFSYCESGTQITWDRDKAVNAFFQKHSIEWQEFQRDGIIRAKRNRSDWDKLWYTAMSSAIIKNTYSPIKEVVWKNDFPLPEKLITQLENYPSTFQPAGEHYAHRYLQSFLADRGDNYSKYISRPHESRQACSRLSPYLAWGNISLKTVYQSTYIATKQKNNKLPYRAFMNRLAWHCHFIQKFEAECRYETSCINRGYELLEYHQDKNALEAWKNGTTGVPLVDACMRCLHATGWINFRMRALLVSFLCHNLFIHWREGVYHLAQLFLDYEPGIHYPQFQMQAGTTGINTIRIYNPVKNGEKHDEHGFFVRKWIPELANVPLRFLHEPWKMTLMEQQMAGFQLERDYPYPIVDMEKGVTIARDKIWAHRKHPEVLKENKRILALHVRAKKAKPKSS